MSMFLTALLASVLWSDGAHATDPSHPTEGERWSLRAETPLQAERHQASLVDLGQPAQLDAQAATIEGLPLSGPQAQLQLEELLSHTRAIIGDIDPTASVTGRVKSIESTLQKMARKQISAQQIRDQTALRVIVSTEEDCYTVLQALSEHHDLIPGTLKDYIQHPKANGYQSLHGSFHTQTQVAPGGVVEFQVRTIQMHEYAEHGGAAHWLYKQQPQSAPNHATRRGAVG